MRGLIGVVLLLLVADVYADAAVDVCYNYGCAAQTSVTFSTERLLEVAALLSRANSPTAERALLGQALGPLYAWAGEQSPIASDRHGNYADDGVEGRMDCIDHSLTTTRMLELLADRGLLRWHRVVERERRVRGLVFQHFSAVIEEVPGPSAAGSVSDPSAADGAARRFAVDSWFVDNGQPAVILPLAAWLDGEGLDVE